VETTEGLSGSGGAVVGLVLDSSPFYSEAGGQVCDVGRFSDASGSTPLLDVRAVQVFGGFVVHNGLLPSGSSSIRVGDTLTCEVDYEHRRKVAPNHTMTHTLNWALREVLGEGADQRGSLVNAERLRFDFAADAVSVEQLARVEALVQEVIAAKVPVSVRETSLADAKSIAGLRAVPGEAYPDPVRVVTVGAGTIDELLAAPGEAKWKMQSVEFCGGTHIKDSSEAGAFVILEEKAIAKGIRRIIGATGPAAAEALAEGGRLAGVLAALEVAKEASEAEVLELSKALDAADISAVLKADCRDRLDTLRKKLKKSQKGADKAVLTEANASLKKAAQDAVRKGDKHMVLLLVDVDPKVLMQVIGGAPKDMAALILSPADDGTVHCVAAVPAELSGDGKGADGWVRAALAPLGGTGGGKPERAQGSAKGAAADIAAAEAAASAYFASARA